MTQKILDIFQRIALPVGFENISKSRKVLEMTDVLNELGFSAVYEENIGLIVNKQKNPRIVLVSHLDLVRPFKSGFARGETFVVHEKGLDGQAIVQGALDNTLTNAVALKAIEELKNTAVEDVEVLFSIGEETGLTGMRSYLNKYPEKSMTTFFLNLDVTNDNWDKAISVEFDRPVQDISDQTTSILKGLSFRLQNTRFTDDTSAVNSFGACGYSYCIPTDNYCHSYDSFAMLDSIEPYYKGLVRLLSELKMLKVQGFLDL